MVLPIQSCVRLPWYTPLLTRPRQVFICRCPLQLFPFTLGVKDVGGIGTQETCFS